MLTVGVDTSTRYLTVSVIDEHKALSEYNNIGDLDHARLLVPVLQKALKKAGAALDDIGLLSVGIGPGSFTGLRVGVTTMRALAIALEKPIIGVASIDAIAYNGLELAGPGAVICSVLDAKKNQVYAALYRKKESGLRKESDYLLEPARQVAGRLKGPVLFLGDGAIIYNRIIAGKGRVTAPEKSWYPRGAVIGRMALDRYRSGKKSDDPYSLLPLYLYPVRKVIFSNGVYAKDCNITRPGRKA